MAYSGKCVGCPTPPYSIRLAYAQGATNNLPFTSAKICQSLNNHQVATPIQVNNECPILSMFGGPPTVLAIICASVNYRGRALVYPSIVNEKFI